ncbi:aldo/keto reductase [Streptomyces sp. NPDC048612]|uniref:aldo/keto reductase n=1 Tax=Streptomyces sp. NPDC048612 TaxID=3365579 RepID=UPI00371518DE
MRYQTFGRNTGLRVSEYALGTGNFGTRCGESGKGSQLLWARRGAGADRHTARTLFERFAEAGGNFVDTADCYQFGEAEELLGEFLAADRDHFVLSTKFTNGTSPQPRVTGTGNSRKTMVRSVEASLKRLGTDYIDLYWTHFPDDLTPVEEILAAFDDLVRAGKILYAGLSNFPAWRIARAATMADLRGWSPLIGVQTEYSLTQRTPDRELLPMAESLGLGVAMWSPLGGGLLTGLYRRGADGWVSDGKRAIRGGDGGRQEAVVDVVRAVAEETGAPAAQVAVAWVRERARRAATALVPVIGPRSPGQLDDYLAALDLTLTDEQYARLCAAGTVPAGAPHEVNALARDAVLGGDPGRVTAPAVPVP